MGVRGSKPDEHHSGDDNVQLSNANGFSGEATRVEAVEFPAPRRTISRSARIQSNACVTIGRRETCYYKLLLRVSEEDAVTRARRYALPLIALLTIGLVPGSSVAQPAFEGVYIARGVDRDGMEYRRAVEVERHRATFTVTWVSARIVGEAIVLEPAWVGVGIATGDTLSVSFTDGETFGIIVYEAGANKNELSGRWTLAGDDEAIIRTEVLTKLPDDLPALSLR